MNQSPQHLIKLLEKNGFIFKRSKGSHQIFYNTAPPEKGLPTFSRVITINKILPKVGNPQPEHGNKDVKKGTFF